MNLLNFIEKPDRVVLAQQLAEDVAEMLQHALKERGTASLVVSGGSTPKDFFLALNGIELDWGNVVITLADERCVPKDHQDRNEKMVAETLLQARAAPAKLLGLLGDTPNVESATDCRETEQSCSERLATISQPFDVVVLGMGEDAHTASLFPHAEGVSEALNPKNPALCQIIDPTDAPHRRITMTLSALTDAHRVILHITGNKKRQVLEEAIAQGGAVQAPIAAVLKHAALGQNDDGESANLIDVYWST